MFKYNRITAKKKACGKAATGKDKMASTLTNGGFFVNYRMRVYLPLLWVLVSCHSNAPRSGIPDISYVAVGDYRYLAPCGNPAYSDTLAAGKGRGDFNVYVLKDSSDVNNCIAPAYPILQKQAFPMRYGKDFLLAVEMNDAPDWGMDVKVTRSEGGILELMLIPVRQKSGKEKAQYIWHFAADDKRVVKLLGANRRFAYAKGPAWQPGQVWQEEDWAQGK